MKDVSLFQGWKELAGLDGRVRLQNVGKLWGVYKHDGEAYVFAGHVDKKPRESNTALYKRVMEAL